jgi:hypothetical protein
VIDTSLPTIVPPPAKVADNTPRKVAAFQLDRQEGPLPW